MYKKNALLSTIAFGFALASHAYEVDNFTARYQQLEDSRALLNNEVNHRFSKIADEANKEGIKCSSPKDFRILFKDTLASGSFIGTFEAYVENDEDSVWSATKRLWTRDKKKIPIPRHSTKLNDSIYKYAENFKVTKAFDLNSSLRIGNVYLGSDKLGHFFDQGCEYYERFKSSGSILDALKLGKDMEESQFGSKRTGIKSYADMAANYSGFLFWKNLNEGENPYFKCQDGKWKQVRNFDWAEYVNHSWDEAINCSEFTLELKTAVERRAKELEAIAQTKGKTQKYSCPVDEQKCFNLKKLTDSRFYIHKTCRDIKEPTENLNFNYQTPNLHQNNPTTQGTK